MSRAEQPLKHTSPEPIQQQPDTLYKRVINIAAHYLGKLVDYQAPVPPHPDAAAMDELNKLGTR